jgi:hypothetical protein
MDPLNFEMVNRNPELVRALVEQARRERAEAVHRLLVAPIVRLFRRRHAARPDLRHPRKACSAAA